MSDPTTDERIRVQTSTVKGRTYPRFSVELGRIEGKRKRKTFKTYEEAEDFLAGHDERTLAIGEKAADLETDDLLDAVQAKDVSQTYNQKRYDEKFYPGDD